MPAREALEELQSLVSEHKWWRNGFRTNLDTEESHRRRDRSGREWLKYPFAPRSNTIREGPILECVQQQLGPHINAVCLPLHGASHRREERRSELGVPLGGL